MIDIKVMSKEDFIFNGVQYNYWNDIKRNADLKATGANVHDLYHDCGMILNCLSIAFKGESDIESYNFAIRMIDKYMKILIERGIV